MADAIRTQGLTKRYGETPCPSCISVPAARYVSPECAVPFVIEPLSVDHSVVRPIGVAVPHSAPAGVAHRRAQPLERRGDHVQFQQLRWGNPHDSMPQSAREILFAATRQPVDQRSARATPCATPRPGERGEQPPADNGQREHADGAAAELLHHLMTGGSSGAHPCG
jgi:hypothetical protein